MSHYTPTNILLLLLLLLITVAATSVVAATDQILDTRATNFKLPIPAFRSSKRFEGSSNLVNLKYHMGPVLSSAPINVYVIWYGLWAQTQQAVIKDFIHSLSPPANSYGHSNNLSNNNNTVSEWWKTVSMYTDQTGESVSRNFVVAGEYSDRRRSRGSHLTRLSVQEVIANAVKTAPFPVDHKHGIYLILTSEEVTMQDYCRAVCGFHYFTFPSLVGYTLPYAWIGNSGKQCPEVCAYPFAIPAYMTGGGLTALKPPNNDVGVDGMISVIGHELAELSSNPLINAWYAGEDPTAPTEIGDLCEGLYGTGGGGGYTGQVMRDREGKTFNMYGKNGRKFLVQWLWNPVLKACVGPNAMD